MKVRFKPTVQGIPTAQIGGDEFGYYTNYAVVQPLEESVESQNDNLGKDIASQDGNVLFRRTPVVWVPWLDRDTTNPFYGINWSWVRAYVLGGEWMRETNIEYTPGQHNVSSHFVDLTWYIVVKNRRANFCLSNGTTYPS